MFRFGKLSKKFRIAPIEGEPKEANDMSPKSESDGTSNPPSPSQSSEQINVFCTDEDSFPIREFKLDPDTLLLDLDSLPAAHSKTFLHLYKIPEFKKKYSATVVHLAHRIDIMIDEMIIALFPIIIQYIPNLGDEPPLQPFDDYSPSSPSSSPSLPNKVMGEISCCLWIIQESLAILKSSSSSTKSLSALQSDFLLDKAKHKLTLKCLASGLKSLKPIIRSYLDKIENVQQNLGSITNTMKIDYKGYRSTAKLYYQKYLTECQPNSIHALVVNKAKFSLKSNEDGKIIKFNCTPAGYTIYREVLNKPDSQESDGEEDAKAGPGGDSWPMTCRHLPTNLQSEIVFNVMRELEYRIHKTVNDTPASLRKNLRKSSPDKIYYQLGQLLKLTQFHGLKLPTNGAVAILFGLKRAKTKVELFKDLLIKYENNIAVTRKSIQQLHKSVGKAFKRVGKGSAGDGGGDISTYGGNLSEQMLRYSRTRLIKLYDKMEIKLYTDWPECFNEYILQKPNVNSSSGNGSVSKCKLCLKESNDNGEGDSVDSVHLMGFSSAGK